MPVAGTRLLALNSLAYLMARTIRTMEMREQQGRFDKMLGTLRFIWLFQNCRT